MKIPILTDTHFGIRNDSSLFLDYFFKFYDNVFFPYLEENDITTVIHAGDFLDRRKYVNFNTLNRVRTEFLFPLFSKYNIKMHCIAGNHDTYFKNTNEVNCIREIFSDQYPDNINYYDSPQVVNFDGMDIAFLPWISQDNEEKSMKFVETAPAEWLIGHLEFCGFEVIPGIKHDFGHDHKLFSRYEQVISGHFHTGSEMDNVKYLGSPYQMTFSDVGDLKGFWVLDTDDRSLEFIENPYEMFYSLRYDDTVSDYGDLLDSLDKYSQKYVKIYVAEKKKPELLDKIIDSLYGVGVHNLTVIEDMDGSTSKDDKDDDEDTMNKSTIDLLVEEVRGNPKVNDQERVQKLVKELYLEALRQ